MNSGRKDTSRNIEYWVRIVRLPFTAIAAAVFVANNKNFFGLDTLWYWVFVVLGLGWITGGAYIDGVTAIRVLETDTKSPSGVNMGKRNSIAALASVIMLVVATNIFNGRWLADLSQPWRIGLSLSMGLGVVFLLAVLWKGRRSSKEVKSRKNREKPVGYMGIVLFSIIVLLWLSKLKRVSFQEPSVNKRK